MGINLTALHSGDLGDVIYSMPTLRRIFELTRHKPTLHLVTRPWTKEFTKSRFLSIKPLLESQEYIGGVSDKEPDKEPDYDFSTFRSGGMPWGRDIVALHSRWMLGEARPYKPWLVVHPDPRTSGRILLHRSPRYRNHQFDWGAVVEAAGDKALSVCTEDEHDGLEKAAGAKIERLGAGDFLELAGMIRGSEQFVGNQSSPMAVAIGLGHPTLQEITSWIPDCIYPDAPIDYSANGGGIVNGVSLLSKTRLTVKKGRPPLGGWVVSFGGESKKCTVSNDAERWLKAKGFEGDLTLEVLRQNTERVLRDHPESLSRDIGRLITYLRSMGLTVDGAGGNVPVNGSPLDRTQPASTRCPV